MRKPRHSLLTGAVVATGSLALAVWSSLLAAQAMALVQFEAEPAASLSRQAGSVQDTTGVGPLSLDVVRTDHAGTVKVVRQAEALPEPWPRPLLIVGEHGAYYVGEPAPEGTWIPFAVAAGLALLAACAGAWFAASNLRGSGARVAFVLFGQRAEGSPTIGWLPGHGGHGGHGGQVPPFVPHSVDWEPRNRIP